MAIWPFWPSSLHLKRVTNKENNNFISKARSLPPSMTLSLSLSLSGAIAMAIVCNYLSIPSRATLCSLSRADQHGGGLQELRFRQVWSWSNYPSGFSL